MTALAASRYLPHVRGLTTIPLIAAILAPAGCMPAGDETGAVFRYADTQPEYLDPNMSTETAGMRILLNLFEGLTCFAPDDGPVRPGMATHWDVDETGTLWTFHLRTDATWSDGLPVTARDFVYSWRRVVDPATNSKGAQYMWYVRNGRAITSARLPPSALGVTALDEHTLMVELEEPTSYLLELLALPTFAPVPRHVVEDRGTGWDRPENIVTNGAYLLEESNVLDRIVLVKSPTYHDADQVRVERVEVIISDDTATQYKMYVAGETDWLFHIPPSYIPHLRRKRDDFHVADYLATYYYACNIERPPLDDPKVRKALYMAIDREALVRYVTKGQEKPAAAMVPRMPGYDGPIAPGFDPETAKRLLADAGYPNGAGMRTLEISFNTGENHKLIAQAIQEMFKRNLNIDVTLQNMEWKVYLKKQHIKDYDIGRMGWIGDYRDPMTFLEVWYCDASNNHTGFCDPEFDALLNEARAQQDVTVRMATLRRAEERLLQEMPLLPIYHYSMPFLLSDDVGGFEQNIRDVHLFKYIYREAE